MRKYIKISVQIGIILFLILLGVSNSYSQQSTSRIIIPDDNCDFDFQTTFNVPASLNTQTVNVTISGGDCGWVPSSNDSWITAAALTHYGSGSFVFTCSANNGLERTGTLNFTMGSVVVTITVIQASSAPPTPGLIMGVSSTCATEGQVYSINPVSGATSYTWVLPTGSTFESGQGTTQIAVLIGSTSGYVKVKANNGTVSSAYRQKYLTVYALPNLYPVTGGGSYCSGAGGVAVGLGDSQSGISYQLKRGSTNVGSPVSGTGSAISFGNQTIAGTYTVMATSNNNCTKLMSGSKTITVNALPNLYSVTGGGSYCSGESGVSVGLSDSQSGISYQLLRNGSNIGNAKSGTGYSISFGNQTLAGTYTVLATNTTTACTQAMTGSTVVSISSVTPPTVNDNSRCGDGEVTLIATPEVSSHTVKWYTLGGLNITSGTSFTPNITNTTNYIVKTYNPIAGCYSDGVTATATKNPIPSNPVSIVEDGSCGAGVVDLSAQPGTDGNQVKWYSAGDVLLATNTNFSPVITATTNYTVKTYNETTTCISSGSTVTATKHLIPTDPVSIVEDGACVGDIVYLSAQPGTNANQVNWYNENGDLLATNTEYSTVISSTKNFKAKSLDSNTGCLSPFLGVSVRATAYSLPSNPISIIEDEVCESGEVTLSAQAGSGGDNVKWYTLGGTLLAANTIYNDNILNTTNYTVKTENSSTGCESTGTTVTATVNSNPSIPVVLNNEVAISGIGLVVLEAQIGSNGNEVRWYASDGDFVDSGTEYSPYVLKNTSYNVTSYNSETACESESAVVNAIVNDLFEYNKAKTNSKNYVRKIVPKAPIKYISELDLLNNDQVVEQISYYDGLGRTEQTQVMGTGDPGESLIQFYSYDKYGRIDISYLPFTHETEGVYLSDASTKQSLFYLNNEDKIANDNSPWATVKYEDSPLSRVKKAGAVGDDWQINADGTGNIRTADYLTNKSPDSVINWEYDAVNDKYIGSDNYAEGTLYKNITSDENGKTAISFTNKDGKLILKEQEELKTYYIYDNYGRIKHVLPPEFVEQLPVDKEVEIDDELVQKYCYTYVYGARSLLVEKHIPGIEKIEYVYDKLNRPVLSCNGNLRNNKQWSFVKYDNIGRGAYSGIWTDPETGLVDPENGAITGVATRKQLQNIIFAEADVYESYDFTTDVYSSNVFPTQNMDIHVLNVYDNYPTSTKYYFDGVDDDPTYSVNSLGKLTYTKVKILDGTGDYLETVMYYDNKDRLIQKHSDNVFGYVDIVNMEYNFMGQVTEQIVKHGMPGNSIEEVSKFYTYDQANRLKSVEQEIKADLVNDESRKVKMLELEYNKLGQVIAKKLHETASNGFLQTIDYNYNIRGWLTDINNPDAQSTDDLFAMRLHYNDAITPGSQVQNNGMISGIEWKVFGSDPIKRAYAYKYDEHYRLTDAYYSESANPDADGRYNVNLTYTANGKISTLYRYGLQDQTIDPQYGIIDSLRYEYDGNQLIKVTDDVLYGVVKHNVHFPDEVQSTSDEYHYDDNGNMTFDDNKNLDNITYNHLNLPLKVTFDSDNYIEFTYDAVGNKLKKKVVQDGGIPNYYTFVGGFMYHNNVLKQISTETGRVVFDEIALTYDYQYFLRDQLGSVRVIFNEGITNEAEIIEENHYYPFGMRISGLGIQDGTNNTMFSGKELQKETFGDVDLCWYDFGARNYDPSLGNWFNVDPMAEYYYKSSPYHFAGNNPVNNREINGMAFTTGYVDPWGDSGGISHDGSGNSSGSSIGGIDPPGQGFWPSLWHKITGDHAHGEDGEPNCDAGRMSHAYNNSRSVGSYANGGIGESPESNGGVSAGGGGNTVAIPETPSTPSNVQSPSSPPEAQSDGDNHWIPSPKGTESYNLSDWERIKIHLDRFERSFDGSNRKDKISRNIAVPSVPEGIYGGLFQTLGGILMNTPHSPIYHSMTPGQLSQNRAYFNTEIGYFEWSWHNSDQTIIQVNQYQGYDRVDGVWRGANLISTGLYDLSGYRIYGL